MVVNIVIGLVVLSVIIIVHELGHFVSAKATGVKVEEFGLGYPPRLVSTMWRETRYSLNAIPFGGFVKMAGEEDPDVEGSLAGKNTPTRLLVLGAGSLMNILLAFLLLSIAFMVPHPFVTEPVIVKEVALDSPAARAGFVPGDTVTGINGQTVHSINDLHRQLQLNLGNEVTLLIRHPDTTEESVQVIPRWEPPEGEGAIGIGLDVQAALNDRTVESRSYPFWKAIPRGIGTFAEIFVLYKNGIISIIIGAAKPDFIGPVGLVQATGEVASAGVSPLLEFAAFICLIVGILNLFPLPALDGGRIAFVLLEWVRRGKRIAAKTEGMVHLIGFAMLIVFMLAVTYQDILRIIRGESPIP